MPFSGGSLPSLDGLLSPSLSGAFLISLLTELSSGGSLPILNRFLDSLNGLSSGGPLPSLDGLLSPSLSGALLVSWLDELSLPFSGGSLPILNRFLGSVDGLSLPFLGVPWPSLDRLSPSLGGLFLIVTEFGGEAVPGGVVESTLTPDLQCFSGFSGFGSGQFLIS